MTRRWLSRRFIKTAVPVTVLILGGAFAGATLLSARQGLPLVRGNKPGEWRYWGADAWSTRYSPLDQINAQNFDSLQVAWKWDAGQYGEDEYYRTTPLYANGRIFTVATTCRKAFGIDPKTKRLGQLREEAPDARTPSNTQFGWVWEGSSAPTVPVGESGA